MENNRYGCVPGVAFDEKEIELVMEQGIMMPLKDTKEGCHKVGIAFGSNLQPHTHRRT